MRLVMEANKRRYDPTPIMNAWTNNALQSMWEEKQVDDMIDVDVQLSTAEQFSRVELETFAQIVGHTSGADYIKSGKGWDFNGKVQELSEPNMMFLVFRAAAGSNATFAPTLPTNVIAFTAFRLDEDEIPCQERTLMYIWEIHVSERFRGKGISSFLIKTVESMARIGGVTKSMLTVLSCNYNATAIYQHLGYSKDAASPEDTKTRKGIYPASYILMSKDWGTVDTVETSSLTTLQHTVEDKEILRNTDDQTMTAAAFPNASVVDEPTSPSSALSFERPLRSVKSKIPAASLAVSAPNNQATACKIKKSVNHQAGETMSSAAADSHDSYPEAMDVDEKIRDRYTNDNSNGGEWSCVVM
jgi:GNAT superfamily N-acetyltransferase